MKTVFILGAGASCPYGFPSGYKLVSDILESLTSHGELFTSSGFDQEDILKFSYAIKKAKPVAIDDLLVQRKEFLEIGKLAIADALSPYEDPDKLIQRDIEDDWYSYFFELVKNSPRALMENEFAFVTFNYDRSLEYYLDIATDAFFGGTAQGLASSIKNIPVLHVHGDLGILPSKGGNSPYRPPKGRTDVRNNAQNLKLVAEHADSAVMATAQVLIQHADRIRFLGFGYHDTNLKKLEFNTNSAKCNDVSGTALGMTIEDLRGIAQRYPKLAGVDNHNRKIMQFFRESRPLRNP